MGIKLTDMLNHKTEERCDSLYVLPWNMAALMEEFQETNKALRQQISAIYAENWHQSEETLLQVEAHQEALVHFERFALAICFIALMKSHFSVSLKHHTYSQPRLPPSHVSPTYRWWAHLCSCLSHLTTRPRSRGGAEKKTTWDKITGTKDRGKWWCHDRAQLSPAQASKTTSSIRHMMTQHFNRRQDSLYIAGPGCFCSV